MIHWPKYRINCEYKCLPLYGNAGDTQKACKIRVLIGAKAPPKSLHSKLAKHSQLNHKSLPKRLIVTYFDYQPKALNTLIPLENPVCQPSSQCNGISGSVSGAEIYRVGGDVSLTHAGEWNLFGIYMLANDSKNVFASQGVINPQAARWTSGFVELDYYPNELPFFETPGWFFAYRFGLIRNIQQGDPTFADN